MSLPHITVTVDHNKPVDAPCPARVQTGQKVVEVELTRDLIEAFQGAGNITIVEIPLEVVEVEAVVEAEPVSAASNEADLSELGDAAIEEVTADEDEDEDEAEAAPDEDDLDDEDEDEDDLEEEA